MNGAGYSQVIIAIFAAALGVAVWLGCVYVRFSRTRLRTIVRLGDRGGPSRHNIWTWKYPGWRGPALAGLVVIPLLTGLGLFALFRGGGGEAEHSDMGATAAATTTVPERLPAGGTPTWTPGLTLTPEAPAVPTSTITPSRLPPTETPTLTPSLTPSAVLPTSEAPTATPSLAPTTPVPTVKTSTWSPSPAPATPTPTPTLTLSLTPTPTPTLTPTPTVATPTWVPLPTAVPPEPLEPLLGREYDNPITFRWRGGLIAGEAYQVTAYQFTTGYTIQSELLTAEEWTALLPVERFGEWRWRVAVVRYGLEAVTSLEWMFWFNPHPGTRYPTRTPTPTPTRTPSWTKAPN